MIDILTLDFETYFDTDYTLKKLTTLDYVRDPRFKAHGVAAKINHEPGFWVTHTDLPAFFRSVNWGETFFVAHNTYFDGLVCTQRYNVPHRQVTWSDTLSIARAVIPTDIHHDLDTLGKLFKVGGKIQGVLDKIKGIRDLTPELEAETADYAINDVEKCYRVFQYLYRMLPQDEHDLLHITLRMAVEPVLELDLPLIQEALDEAITEQRDTIARCNYPKSELTSNPKFAKILESLDIPVPKKISLTTGKETFALSKNDLGFKALWAQHPEHVDLFNARLAAKSSIGVSRAERFRTIATTGDGKMPMPLKYCGAHTFRWSGQDAINVQNLVRGGKLRRSIRAPKGYVIVVVDSSQIEMRVNAWFCGQQSLLSVFHRGEDPYAATATDHFGYPVEKKTHPDERQFGKLLSLALGFGMGPPKFRTQAALGFMGCPPVFLTDNEAYATVHHWRNKNRAIKEMWDTLQKQLQTMLSPSCDDAYKCVTFRHNRVEMPNGMNLLYPGLRATEDGFLYNYKKRKKIYGGLFLENLVQSIARIAVGEQILRIERELVVPTVGTTHDEGLFLAPESEADAYTNAAIDIMSQSPIWAPDLPLAAEGGWAHEYSK